MNINDLIQSFLNDPSAMRNAKGLVCYSFDIPHQEFDGLLYGAFTKAWQGWNGALASFNTHVLTCLKSECIDFLRKNKQPYHVEYVDIFPNPINAEDVLYMKTVLELVLDKIIDHPEGDMLFRILVCGDNYNDVTDNPAQARKAVERFRIDLKAEFGNVFN